MSLAGVGHAVMVITSGTAISNAIRDFDDALGLTIYAPATLSTTVFIEVEPTTTGTSFVILQSGAVDVEVTANRATVISPVPFLQMRLHSAGNEASTRTFRVSRVFHT